MTTESIWMTPQAQRKLEDELAELQRADHPLSAPEQTRARELRELLARVELDSKPDDGLVEPGMRVTVRFEDDASTATFLLGSREVMSVDRSVDVDVYSPTSPLGAAINGRRVGESVSYAGPMRQHEVAIVSAVPFA